MFKPINDWMILEKIDVSDVIATPDNAQPKTEDHFIVKAVGPGWITNDGQLIPTDVKPGDKICFIGQMWRIPDGKGNRFIVAKAQDVVCVERQENGEIEKAKSMVGDNGSK